MEVKGDACGFLDRGRSVVVGREEWRFLFIFWNIDDRVIFSSNKGSRRDRLKGIKWELI